MPAAGLRERNKQDKLSRIVAAARQLFARNGFERTTVATVAEAAGIGAGTLFLYARSKEDLLVLVFRQELQQVVDKSFQTLPARANLLRRLGHVYGAVIDHHGRNLGLSRHFAKELMFVGPDERPRIAAFMNDWMGRIAGLIEQAKARGEVAPDADARLLATSSFALFFHRLQSWVAGHMTRERLECELAASLALLLAGAAAQRREGAKPMTRRGIADAGTPRRRAAARPERRPRNLDR